MAQREEAVTALVYDARPAQQGAELFEQASNKVLQANRQVTQATERVEQVLGRQGAALERLRRELDPVYQAQQRLERGQAVLDRAFQRGAISAEQQAQLLERLQQKYGTAAAAAQQYARGLDSALERERMIAAARAQQVAANSQDRYNAALGVRGGAGGSAAASAAVFAEAEAERQAASRAVDALVPLRSAMREVEEQERQLAAARRLGIATAEELAAAETALAQRKQYLAQASGQAAGGVALLKGQMQTLGFTASDAIASLSSGASIMTIIGQQGPQVAQAFLMVEGGVAALKGALIAAAPIIGAVTAGLAAAGAVYYAVTQETARAEAIQKKYTATLALAKKTMDEMKGAGAERVRALEAEQRFTLGAARATLEKIQADIKAFELLNKTGTKGTAGQAGGIIAGLKEQAEAARNALNDLNLTYGLYNDGARGAAKATGEGVEAITEFANATERFRGGLRGSIAQLTAEAAAQGQSSAEKERARLTTEALAAAQADNRKSIDDTTRALIEQEVALRRNIDARTALRSATPLTGERDRLNLLEAGINDSFGLPGVSANDANAALEAIDFARRTLQTDAEKAVAVAKLEAEALKLPAAERARFLAVGREEIAMRGEVVTAAERQMRLDAAAAGVTLDLSRASQELTQRLADERKVIGLTGEDLAAQQAVLALSVEQRGRFGATVAQNAREVYRLNAAQQAQNELDRQSSALIEATERARRSNIRAMDGQIDRYRDLKQAARDETDVLRQRLAVAGGDPRTRAVENRIVDALRNDPLLRNDPATLAALRQQYALQEDVSRQIEQMEASYRELEDFGSRAFDRIGEALTAAFARGEDAMVSLRSVGKAVLSELLQDFIRLAAINPLRNMLFGSNAPTLGSVAGALGSMGGGAGGVGHIASGISSLGSLFSGGYSSTLAGIGTSIAGSNFGAAIGLSSNASGMALDMVGGNVINGAGSAFSQGLGYSPWGILGSLGANLFGLGGGIGGTIGGLAGSVAGGALGASALGSILGAAGGPLGAIVGGFAGTALGGLFGGRPSIGPRYGSGFVSSGGATSGYSNTDNGGDAQAAARLSSGIAQAFASVAALSGARLGNTAVHVEQRQNGAVLGLNGATLTGYADAGAALADALRREMARGAFVGAGSSFVTAAANSNAKAVEGLLEDLGKAATYDGIVKAAKALTDVEQAMKALTDTAAEQDREFRRLGLDVAAAQAGRARSFDQQVADQLKQALDPKGWALELEERNAAARLDAARKFGADLAQVEKLNALQRQAVLEQFGQQQAQELERRLSGLQGYIDRLTFGDLANDNGPFAAVRNRVLGTAQAMLAAVPGFSEGGVTGNVARIHPGELLYTGPSARVFNPAETRALLAGPDMSGVVTELRNVARTVAGVGDMQARSTAEGLASLRRENAELRGEIRMLAEQLKELAKRAA